MEQPSSSHPAADDRTVPTAAPLSESHASEGSAPPAQPRMKPEVKARWVAALRSGKYKQGDRRVLNEGDGDKFCCLGVLCDLYAKEHGVEWIRTHSGEAMLLEIGQRNSLYPPDAIREWARFHEDYAPVQIGEAKESVAVHNDGISCPRRTFAEIADAIESQL